MPPTDDIAGPGAGTNVPGSKDLDILADFAQTLASIRGTPASGGFGPAFGASGFARADLLRSHGLPVGLTVPSIQLAHALELLNRRQRRLESRAPDHREPVLADAPFGAPDPYPLADPEPEMGGDAEEARRLVADALAALAGSAGLSVPMGALTQAPEPMVVDPEVEAVFAELDMARAAWAALPADAEARQPHPDVDRYFAAEEAVLTLADGSSAVLGRQARLLLELADEIADQMGPAAANAIANVAQGLLLRLRL